MKNRCFYNYQKKFADNKHLHILHEMDGIDFILATCDRIYPNIMLCYQTVHKYDNMTVGWVNKRIAGLVVNYGISNTIVLEIP